MTTTTPDYRAQTDPGTKLWHLGSEQNGPKCYCGAVLVTPGDTRAFARKLSDAKRNYSTDPSVRKVTCGACKRNREYAYATGTPRPAEAAPARRTRSAGRSTAGTGRVASAERLAAAAELDRTDREGGSKLSAGEAAEMAAAAAERNGDAAAPPKTRARRKSRADKANAAQDADRAKRAKVTGDADATVAKIEAAVAGLGN